MATGAVKWFDSQKGYGFIQPQGGGGKDVFVHISAVVKAGLSSLNEGQIVEYQEVANRGKCRPKISGSSDPARSRSAIEKTRRAAPAGLFCGDRASVARPAPWRCRKLRKPGGPNLARGDNALAQNNKTPVVSCAYEARKPGFALVKW